MTLGAMFLGAGLAPSITRHQSSSRAKNGQGVAGRQEVISRHGRISEAHVRRRLPMTLPTLFRVLIVVLLTTTATLRVSAKELRCVYTVTQETVQGKSTQPTGSGQAGKLARAEVKSFTMTLGLGDHYFFCLGDKQ